MEKVELPEFPIHGGCQCGKLRYALKAQPVTFYCCHCTECQRQSSSAFGQSMRVRLEDIEVTGEMARFACGKTDSGSALLCDFCPSSGVRLFHQREAYGTDASFKAGSLDDTSWLVPAGHIWTGSKQKWVVIAQGELSYAGQPNDYEKLKSRWQAMINFDMNDLGEETAMSAKNECVIVVRAPAGTAITVTERLPMDLEEQPAPFFEGKIDGSGELSVPVPRERFVVFAVGFKNQTAFFDKSIDTIRLNFE
jgi:hypothetical protein